MFLADAYILSLSLSTLVNFILAVLIASRLVYHRRYIRNTLGVEHGSPYTNIITMCVDSSALMVIVADLATSLHFVEEYWSNFANEIAPHIFVGGLELNDF